MSKKTKKNESNMIYLPEYTKYLDSFIPEEELEKEKKYQEERNGLLKKHPKYVSIVKRLDEPIFQGDLSPAVEQFNNGEYTIGDMVASFDKAFDYVDTHRDIEQDGKELFINISPGLLKIMKKICNVMEFINIDLSLYRYKEYIVCEAPECSGYTFNVYTLKEEN